MATRSCPRGRCACVPCMPVVLVCPTHLFILVVQQQLGEGHLDATLRQHDVLIHFQHPLLDTSARQSSA